ncbi:hypothetical protein [Terriglobus aquaticus]|uniref:Lipoprotein n=1 Tax=Terriglobus aquaticus TaxID=940139 RepID=A0ABW9KIY1_9BACT|nr:hypothetical protein [Terriglobus aquaticus]
MPSWVKNVAAIFGMTLMSCLLNGCLESEFDLADASKLPKALALPTGQARANYRVRLRFYSTYGYDATFALIDSSGHTVREVRGKTVGSCADSSSCRITTEDGETEVLKLRPYEQHAGMEKNRRPVALFEFIGEKP